MTKQIIAVDIDDVISVNAPSFVAFSNEKWGTHLTVEEFEEDWAKIWGIDKNAMHERMDVLQKERFVRNHAAMEGARHVLEDLSAHFTLVITTSRSGGLIKDTHEWIDEHFPGVFNEVYFSGIWDGLPEGASLQTKAGLLKKIGAHYLIDDQPKHCLAAAEIGIETLLYGDYPWNRHIKSKTNVTRVHGWQEVKAYFDAK